MSKRIVLDIKTVGFEGMEWIEIVRHKFQGQMFKALSSPFVAPTQIALSVSPCSGNNSRKAERINHMNV